MFGFDEGWSCSLRGASCCSFLLCLCLRTITTSTWYSNTSSPTAGQPRHSWAAAPSTRWRPAQLLSITFVYGAWFSRHVRGWWIHHAPQQRRSFVSGGVSTVRNRPGSGTEHTRKCVESKQIEPAGNWNADPTPRHWWQAVASICLCGFEPSWPGSAPFPWICTSSLPPDKKAQCKFTLK